MVAKLIKRQNKAPTHRHKSFETSCLCICVAAEYQPPLDNGLLTFFYSPMGSRLGIPASKPGEAK